MAKCTCCSCWQSVADQNLMVHTFVVTIKNLGSCGVRLHVIQLALLPFTVFPHGTVDKTLFNSEYLKVSELKDHYATLASAY